MLKSICYLGGFLIALFIIWAMYGCKKEDSITPQPAPNNSPQINSSITDTSYLKIYADEWTGNSVLQVGTYYIGTPSGEGEGKWSFAIINSATIIDSLDGQNYGSSWTYAPSGQYFNMSVTINPNSLGFNNTVSMKLVAYTTLNPLMANLPVTLQLIGHPYK